MSNANPNRFLTVSQAGARAGTGGDKIVLVRCGKCNGKFNQADGCPKCGKEPGKKKKKGKDKDVEADTGTE